MDKNIRKKNFFPITLSIEMVKGCVNKCFFCNSPSEKIFLMPPYMFSKIIDELEKIKIDNLTPFGMGESLIHPFFYKLINNLVHINKNKSSFNDMVLNTSGILLEENLLIKILEKYPKNGFHRLHFSLDSITDLDWKKIGKIDSLSSITEKIVKIIKWKNINFLDNPKITVSYVYSSKNKQIQQFIDKWSEIFTRYHQPYEITHNWPNHNMNAIYLRKDTRYEIDTPDVCNHNNFIIKSNGDIFCCVRNDVPENFKIGNIIDNSLEQIFLDKNVQNFINGKTLNNFCKSCINEC